MVGVGLRVAEVRDAEVAQGGFLRTGVVVAFSGLLKDFHEGTVEEVTAGLCTLCIGPVEMVVGSADAPFLAPGRNLGRLLLGSGEGLEFVLDKPGDGLGGTKRAAAASQADSM